MTTEAKISTLRTLLTVRQFSEKHPAFSQGSLRNLIFLSKPRDTSRGTIHGNGMADASVLVRLGRRLLIDELKFFQWLDDQQDSPVKTIIHHSCRTDRRDEHRVSGDAV